MEHARNFDEQNYDKSIVDHRRNIESESIDRAPSALNIYGERLVGKILTNRQSFVKFVTAARLFHWLTSYLH